MSTKLEVARQFAAQAHGAQMYGQEPYTKHLQDVENVLRRFSVEYENMLVAAWLHDTLEDTNTDRGVLRALFGKDVMELVAAVTNTPGTRKQRHAATYAQIKAAGPRAIVLKLADRIANVEHSILTKSHLVGMYRREYVEFYAALEDPDDGEPASSMWDYLHELMT